MGQMKRVASGDGVATSILIRELNRLGYPQAGSTLEELGWRMRQRPGRVLTARPPKPDAGLDAVPAAMQPAMAASAARTAVDVSTIGPPPVQPMMQAKETPQATANRLGLMTATHLRKKRGIK